MGDLMADEIGTMPDVLARICADVQADVATRKATRGIDALRNEIAARNDPPRGFAYALKSASASGRYGLIPRSRKPRPPAACCGRISTPPRWPRPMRPVAPPACRC